MSRKGSAKSSGGSANVAGGLVADESGYSEQDWEIFDVLCSEQVQEPPCVVGHSVDHLSHSLDLVTTLRSELAASTYKRDRLLSELSEAKSALCAKETECESLRAQTARQSTMIGSLQSRLQAAENRERNLQTRSENTTATLQRDKRCLEDKSKEMCSKIRRLECDLSTEESQKEQAKSHLHDLIRRLCLCLGVDVCDNAHLTPDSVLTKAGEMVAELQRLRNKMASTCETLTHCEAELINARSLSTADKARLQSQVDTLQAVSQEMEGRVRQMEKELHVTRDRLTESEVNSDKLKEELRGFESRCGRLQNTLDRFQNDRLQFLRNIASMINVNEPCETLIKDKIREIVGHNQQLHNQVSNLREQIDLEGRRHREFHDTTACRLRTEETQRCNLEERLEKAQAEIQTIRTEHTVLCDYLLRLARALSWSECTEPPAPGTDTTILAESLLERAERLALQHENHVHNTVHEKVKKESHHFWDHPQHHSSQAHHHHHPPHLPKLRRERSCHDIPLKESSAMYNLQRRVRVLREQVQRRDMHLELLRRKIALLEDSARCKTILQTERDEAVHRARRSCKNAERCNQQMIEIKAQLAEAKTQLAEAADYKITSLERARKIDELQSRLLDVENEKCKLLSQMTNYKTRARSAVESSNDKRCRDEQTINGLRDEIQRLKTSLADTNHRLSQLQAFRSSVARLLHLRDLPETDILQRLQTLCNAHQEFTLLSRRYEAASPVGEHPCPRYDDLIPPSSQCRPISSSPRHLRRFDDFNDDHFDDEYDFSKKY